VTESSDAITKTCQHVLTGGQNVTPVFCGKPAHFYLPAYGYNLCGIHRRSWHNRGFLVESLGDDPPTRKRSL
jgi:hypothetical protein